VIVIYLSVWLYAKRDQLSEVGFGLFPLSGILGIFGGLIYLQPDLSAVITIILLGGILFFLAGADMRPDHDIGCLDSHHWELYRVF
jgi:cell division protein FtsW